MRDGMYRYIDKDDAIIDRKCAYNATRPYMLGYCENCDDCVYSHCEASECWHEPVDGGATGRAVER